MQEFSLELTLSFEGSASDDNEIDFYDVAQALIGFQRSIALTTHLVLNNKVITQAPSLKGAQILAAPPRPGSWELVATIIGGLAFVGTRAKDTPLGHLVHSAYDYVVSSTLGFHVDYEKSLGRQYNEMKSRDEDIPILDETRFDSVMDKCETAVKEMHRPIVNSGTAEKAEIFARIGDNALPTRAKFSHKTYEHVTSTRLVERPIEVRGKVSSYNINTYKGRIFVEELNRPVPFELADEARSTGGIARIVFSLSINAQDKFSQDGSIRLVAFKNESRTGQLKSFLVLEVID